MRILLTNNTLHFRAGSELYIYDVAVELLNRGHQPVAFSTVLGDVAELLRAATVPVIDDPSRLAAQPDIIHGQHHFDTLIAALTFPTAPALNFCHGWVPWEEQPLIFPNVVGYVAVDHVCRDRLVFEHGIPLENIDVVLNFVDTNRFRARPGLPAAPQRAIAFGNAFQNGDSLAILRAACAEAGIELDVAGLDVGRSLQHPEIELGRYDLVFAKARAALEAMATGAAVILCGPRGLGPMVTPEEWDRLRPLNFGVRTLTLPMDRASVRSQIQRYNPAAAAILAERVRSEATLTRAVDQLLHIYAGVIERFPPSGFDPALGQKAAAQYLRTQAPFLKGRAADVLAAVRAQEQETTNALAQANRALTLAKNVRAQSEIALAQANNDLAQERRALTLAETARSETETMLAQADNDLVLQRRALTLAENARVQAEAALAQANCELAELRDSATWRVARSVLQSPLLRFLSPIWRWVSLGRRKAAS
jgi:hypothetical protein